MTRKNFAKGLLAPLFPFAAQAAKKRCYPVASIWETPQGQHVKMLRKEIERLGHWDDLEEDWQAVEDALKEGHLFFTAHPSRLVEKGLNYLRQTYSIRPVYLYQKDASDGKYYIQYLEMPNSKRL